MYTSWTSKQGHAHRTLSLHFWGNPHEGYHRHHHRQHAGHHDFRGHLEAHLRVVMMMMLSPLPLRGRELSDATILWLLSLTTLNTHNKYLNPTNMHTQPDSYTYHNLSVNNLTWGGAYSLVPWMVPSYQGFHGYSDMGGAYTPWFHGWSMDVPSYQGFHRHSDMGGAYCLSSLDGSWMSTAIKIL